MGHWGVHLSLAHMVIALVHHFLLLHLHITLSIPMRIEFQPIHGTWQFNKTQTEFHVSLLCLWLSNVGADSFDKLDFPFKPELTLNTERRKWLLGNMNNQGKGRPEQFIDLFPVSLSFLISKLKVGQVVECVHTKKWNKKSRVHFVRVSTIHVWATKYDCVEETKDGRVDKHFACFLPWEH